MLAALPSAQQSYLASISPCQVAGALKAQVFLMHDRDDPYVPSSEAGRLLAVLPAATQPSLEYFTIFNHVRPDKSLGAVVMIGEVIRLVKHLGRVLAVME